MERAIYEQFLKEFGEPGSFLCSHQWNIKFSSGVRKVDWSAINPEWQTGPNDPRGFRSMCDFEQSQNSLLALIEKAICSDTGLELSWGELSTLFHYGNIAVQ